MIISVPKELKSCEYRVGISPAGVSSVVNDGHRVLIEEGAGIGAGFSDDQYLEAGGELVDRERAWNECDLVVKVKEPVESELGYLRDDLAIFTFLHLAAQKDLTEELVRKGVASIAYETVTDEKGNLPLLKPMSEIAGALSVQAGARGLEKVTGGRGILLPGLPEVAPGKVAVIGAGVSGTMAARVSTGGGADVTVIDIVPDRLERVRDITQQKAKTSISSEEVLEKAVADSDLIILTVLIPGKSAPRIITGEMVSRMKRGACIVDISIDQGGAAETSRPTTHEDPYFTARGAVHYCVTNMPAAVPMTSTLSLTAMTLPFIKNIAALGLKGALSENQHLRSGLSTYGGHITCSAVADSLGLPCVPPEVLLRS